MRRILPSDLSILSDVPTETILAFIKDLSEAHDGLSKAGAMRRWEQGFLNVVFDHSGPIGAPRSKPSKTLLTNHVWERHAPTVLWMERPDGWKTIVMLDELETGGTKNPYRARRDADDHHEAAYAAILRTSRILQVAADPSRRLDRSDGIAIMRRLHAVQHAVDSDLPEPAEPIIRVTAPGHAGPLSARIAVENDNERTVLGPDLLCSSRRRAWSKGIHPATAVALTEGHDRTTIAIAPVHVQGAASDSAVDRLRRLAELPQT